ncbi:c-type cytochrome domain-containing protein [Portibacter marinus]|uniref:c-type cytochrome domain-containing protein n=1 Tax=Portibacter marinus TaxID=2898660 RepID=UPI001F18CD1E|nr:c-type cytochrome domain-containing protein [Portibacter marinus]
MVDFLGRMHILILHLPIGILLMVVILEWVHLIKEIKVPDSVFKVIYFVGAISAIFACITGNILAGGYDYTSAETNDHFWAGIVTALLASVTFLMSVSGLANFRKYASLVVAASIMVTGHLGGSLTHGEGFLNPGLIAYADEKPLEFEVQNVEQADIYHDIVSPLLDNKCVSCHGPNKIKGKLRMDTPEHLQENGKSGNELLTADGELIRRIELPMSHDKHMPPDTKSQLTEQQLKTLKWWIENGSAFDMKVNQIPDHEKMIPVMTKMIEESAQPVDDRKNIPANLPETEVAEADVEIINQLKRDKVVVLPAGEDSPFLEIDFVNIDSLTDDQIDLLAQIAPNIVHLKLSDTRNASKLFTIVENMSNLMKLYLDDTDLRSIDMGLLNKTGQLVYLNLSGTNIGDAQLQELQSHKQLERIYAYDTQATIDSLANGTIVFSGNFTLSMLPSDTIRL